VSAAALDAPPLVPDPHRAVTGSQPAPRRTWPPVLGACFLLLAVYGSLSLLNDPRAALGSDSAGKLATLRVMDHTGSLDIDVGYWAASADPRGTLHPLYYTSRIGGQWVQVTTLPQLIAAYPLYRLGGPRAVLVLPMLGALFTALAARALARRLGGGTGWVAFWAIGLATPVAIYALDVWEHSLGLGLMAWGAVLLLDVAAGRGGWKAAAVGGLLFGAAATMRTEALVPLAVATAIACITVLVRERRLAPAMTRGLAVVVGAATALLGEHVLERVVLGVDLRAGRASHTAAAAGTGAVERAKEALTTAVGLNGFELSTDWLLGVLIVLLVGGGAWCLARRPARTAVGAALFALAAGFYIGRFSVGLGFVPGLFTACPLAAAGLALAWSRRSCRVPAFLACAAIPIVWVAQYSGNVKPQWGGRYELFSGFLLAVTAVVVLRDRRAALIATIALSLAVTACGVVLLSERSHAIADGMEALVARHDQAVISTEGHLLREGGAFYDPDRHWLTATTGHQLQRAAGIIGDAGDTEVAVVAPATQALPAELGLFTRGGADRLEIRPGEPLQVVTYRNSGSP
jgi:hypothetical protein